MASIEQRLLVGVPATLHGRRGLPLVGKLVVNAEDGVIRWENTQRFRLWQVATKSIRIGDIKRVFPGRQTTNFIRTSKYASLSELPILDECSFSICTDDELFDVECLDEATCEEVKAHIMALGRITKESNASRKEMIQPSGLGHFCYSLLKLPHFSYFILLCIILNTITMAMSSPLETDRATLDTLARIDFSVLVIFTIEIIIKIVALEGIRPLLRDRWDMADFVIVLASWLSELPFLHTSFNISAFRSFRAVRALKYFRGIQDVLYTFTGTMGMVVYAILCYFYFLGVYAVVATRAFNTALEYKCAVDQNSTTLVVHPFRFCDPAASTCASIHKCAYFGNPDNGNTGFSSFGTSFVTLYKISARAGLMIPLNGTMQVRSPFAVVFFLAVLVFISYMVLALFVAIVRASFGKMKIAKLAEETVACEKQKAYSAKNRPRSRPSVVVPHCSYKRLGGRVATSFKKIRRRTATMHYKVAFIFPPDGTVVRHCTQIIYHSAFEAIISVCILANTVFLALEYHGMSSYHAAVLAAAETVFTLIFTIEMFLKIIGLRGLLPYLKASTWNKFDCVIVLGAGLDFILSETGVLSGQGASISLLRAVRLLRIVRIMRSNKEVLRVLKAIITSAHAMLNLLFFMLLVNIVFAILGMQLYGGLFKNPDGTTPRANFDSFLDSMLTLFRMFAGGGTWGIFYNALQSDAGETAPLFFLSFNVFSVYVTLNFMVVILLSSFNPTEEEIEKNRESQVQFFAETLAKSAHIVHSMSSSKVTFSSSERSIMSHVENVRKSTIIRSPSQGISLVNRIIAKFPFFHNRMKASLFIFKPDSSVRIWATHCVCSSESFILLCIVVSSTMLALESPAYSKSLLSFVADTDQVFLGIFAAEFVAKIISSGFVLGKKTYLQDPWNRLDIIVLALSALGYLAPASGFGGYFRIGRIFRPLRVVSRNEGMRSLIRAILKSAHEVMYSLVLIFCMFFMFGVLGISLFSGKFARCNDNSVLNRLECHGVFHDHSNHNLLIPRVWNNPPLHFDNIAAALKALFEVVTGKGWLKVLYSAMDITDVDLQPRRDNSAHYAVFFTLFIFIGSFYMLKIFVGIVVGNFRRFNGAALLTEHQVIWAQTKSILKRLQPREVDSTSSYRNKLRKLTESPRFSNAITLVIWTYALSLALRCEPAIEISHWICVVVYTVEAVLNVQAHGLRRHFSSIWSFMEVAIIFGMIIFPFINPIIGNIIGITRALDSSRLTRMLSKLPNLKILFDTLHDTTRLMVNITSLFGLILFIYAILGMHLFGETKWGHNMNANMDFTTFPQALLSLLRLAAGDDWSQVLVDCKVQIPFCSKQADGRSDCGTYLGGTMYFYSFYVLAFLVFLNLYIAAVLDSYILISRKFKWDPAISFSQKDLDHYIDVWSKYDGHALGVIQFKHLRSFLNDLGQPLGLKQTRENAEELNNLLRIVEMRCIDKNDQLGNKAMQQAAPAIPSAGLDRTTSFPKFTAKTPGNHDNEKIHFHSLLLALTRRRVPCKYLLYEERISNILLHSTFLAEKSAKTLQKVYRRVSAFGLKAPISPENLKLQEKE